MKAIVYQISILAVLFILMSLFTYRMAIPAIKGLFWDVNASQAKFQSDKVFCRLNPDKCRLTNRNVNYGVYDFNNTFTDSEIAIDHYFFDWNDEEFINKLPEVFNNSAEKNRWVMLTVEPFAITDDLFGEIKNHQHDDRIKRICTVLNDSPNPVFIRWGHEMERVTGRYPWAVNNPSEFIEGYNYFVNECKSFTSNAYYIWSPAGENNATLYWPGPENVDYIGLSLYIYDQFEYKNYSRVRSFNEAFAERYDRVKGYNKPIIIAELGVNKDQKAWFYNAEQDYNKYPLLKTIVYFNAIDSDGVWENYPTPDWSIDSKIFDRKGD